MYKLPEIRKTSSVQVTLLSQGHIFSIFAISCTFGLQLQSIYKVLSGSVLQNPEVKNTNHHTIHLKPQSGDEVCKINTASTLSLHVASVVSH